MATKTYKGNEVEIVEVKGGWTTFIATDGSTRKARNSEFAGAKPQRAKRAARAKAVATDAPVRKINGAPVNRFAEYERVKRADGAVSFDNGDPVARELRELDLDHVYEMTARAMREVPGKEGAKIADKFGTSIGEIADKLRRRYGKLNPGMQRMNLGNKLRGARSAVERAQEESN